MNLAVLTDIIKETKNNWRFIFEDPLYDKLNFIPGQLIQLVARPGEENTVIRNYSVASWPDGTNKLELIITYLEGGAMSEYLFKEAEIGAEFMYRGPMGIFTLPGDLTDRDIFFVSTGSGISPFRSMINWVKENNVPFKSINLFFGTRTEQDLLYREELQELQSELVNFNYHPVLSREKKEGFKHGHVHEHYLEFASLLDEKPLVYFCGWDRMIKQGRELLAEKGYQMSKDIRVEIFG